MDRMGMRGGEGYGDEGEGYEGMEEQVWDEGMEGWQDTLCIINVPFSEEEDWKYFSEVEEDLLRKQEKKSFKTVSTYTQTKN